MIIIESKRKKPENILKQYPDAIIADVTNHAKDDLVKLSPFYPHGGIPVPFSPDHTAACVEGIWQGLKVFEHCGIDVSYFHNDTMRSVKRTVRTFGRPLGHQKGVNSHELLGYIEARWQIYIPAYQWVLEHKVPTIIERLRKASQTKTIVLLDYNTNPDIDDPTKPLSHAALVKAYAEQTYPFGPKQEEKKDTETNNEPRKGLKHKIIKYEDICTPNEFIKTLGLPSYDIPLYPSQKEICLKGCMFPHFIIGFQYKQNFYVNPWIFKNPWNKDIICEGLDIDQSQFTKLFNESNYNQSLMFCDGNYYILDYSGKDVKCEDLYESFLEE